MCAVQGLQYVENIVTAAEARDLIRYIDSQSWSTALSRRVQEYGRTYHTGRDAGSMAAPIPTAFSALCARLVEQKLMERAPEQVIVNEYEPGQGIAAHVDHTGLFGGCIVTVSLLSAVVMDLRRLRSRVVAAGTAAAAVASAGGGGADDNNAAANDSGAGNADVAIVLRSNSALALSGEARYEWTHAIARRKKDSIGGSVQSRSRRVSVTFRVMHTTASSNEK